MWIKIAKESDIEEGETLLAEPDGRKIAMFRKDGKFYAIDAVCPHRGGPLHEGHVNEFDLICPWHAWTFDIRSGACATSSIPQKTYPVKVERREIWIDAP